MKRSFVLVLLTAASPLGAQSIPVADSLLRVGSLVRAESVYYAAARARPHDPIARWALGRFLVARGAPRVGATLLEESLKFGGEPAIVSRDLVPVYVSIGEYKPLALLASAPPNERARARWFESHVPHVVAPESTLVALYAPPSGSAPLGLVPLRINGHTVQAAVSAKVQGIVLSGTLALAPGLRRFETAGGRAGRTAVIAAADSVSIGRLSLINYPVVIGRVDDRQGAMIGLDVLAHFAPTIDPKAGRITLRVSGAVRPVPPGERFTTLITGGDLRVAVAGGWMSVMQPEIANMLRDRRWTIDAKHGQLVIEP